MDIELIVLLSFAIHMFVFFAGRFHLSISDKFLRSIIGIAYLGANTVAVYALGNLSRQEGSTQSIAFLWAPFLLVHIGGNDTITAWTMEDNNQWLRNLFFIGLRVVLVGYAFWKSKGRHNVELLVSAIFVFVTGIIKCGEKIWSFKSGSIQSLEHSSGRHHYELSKKKNTPLQARQHGRSEDVPAERNGYRQPDEEEVQCADEDEVQSISGRTDGNNVTYSDTVFTALRSMQKVHDIFAARTVANSSLSEEEVQSDEGVLLADVPSKVVELQLGMMHDDLYTKALFLRTWYGLALRFMSMISAWVAFALFLASDRRRYSKQEVAISYSLFVGELFLEFCSMLILMMSPWTWAWLKSRDLNMLAHFSWLLLSSSIGWPEERPRWPTSMGQCNGMHMFVGMYKPQPRSWTPKIMVQVKRFLNVFGVGNEPISWVSNLIQTEYVTVDDKVMKHVMDGLYVLRGEFLGQIWESDNSSDTSFVEKIKKGPKWHFLRSFFRLVQDLFITDFGCVLLMLHVVTDVILSEHRSHGLSPAEDTLVEVCTKLSNYMMYLLVNHPSSLPLNTSAVASLKTSSNFLNKIGLDGTEEERYNQIKGALLQGVQPTGEAPLYELIQMWTRVLLYAASRMKAEHHAAHLARGGELITTVWLHMAIRGIGDSKFKRFRVTNFAPSANNDDSNLMEVYAFNIPQPETSKISRSRSNVF